MMTVAELTELLIVGCAKDSKVYVLVDATRYPICVSKAAHEVYLTPDRSRPAPVVGAIGVKLPESVDDSPKDVA